MMQQWFITVLNMSITASYAILFVCLARFFLRKSPKIFSYSLWSLVLFRLICPVSFSSPLSFWGLLKTDSTQYIPSNIDGMRQPEVNIGIDAVNGVINRLLPPATPYASVNPMQVLLWILIAAWMFGMAVLVIYSILSYFLLKQRVHGASQIQPGVYLCEVIASPFVLGLIKPKIYLPAELSDEETAYILRHEQTHIKHLDYLIKPVAFLTLCLHWFNPLVWIAFVLMSKDMEMSCDETVIRGMGQSIKKNYGNSLLSLAVEKAAISGSPLAFGESGVKSRIKNVLSYKKPTFWVLVTGVVVVVVMQLGLLADPLKPDVDVIETGTPTSYSLNFEELNSTKKHRLVLEQGDVLQINFLLQGKISMKISDELGNVIYRGNTDMKSSEFSVEVPADGVYMVTVSGDRAKGFVRIDKAEPASAQSDSPASGAESGEKSAVIPPQTLSLPVSDDPETRTKVEIMQNLLASPGFSPDWYGAMNPHRVDGALEIYCKDVEQVKQAVKDLGITDEIRYIPCDYSRTELESICQSIRMNSLFAENQESVEVFLRIENTEVTVSILPESSLELETQVLDFCESHPERKAIGIMMT